MDRLAKIVVKLERANEHIQNFERAERDFFANDPYSIVRETDPKAGYCRFYLGKVTDFPAPLVAIVGDAIHNLRSCLDHLASQLVLANGHTPTTATMFPICDDAKRYEAESLRKIEGMNESAKKAISALKPYKGGDRLNTLWQLHQLDIRDKHRLLLTAASRLRARSITAAEKSDILKNFYGSYPANHPAPNLQGVLTAPKIPVQFPLKAGDELFAGLISEIRADMQFNLVIAFNELGVIEGDAVIEFLRRASARVNDIVSDFAPLLA